MFDSENANLIFVILLFFLGLLIMFLFIVRALQETMDQQNELQTQLGLALNDIESKVAALSYEINKIEGRAPAELPPGDGSEPLLTQDDLSIILSQLNADHPALTSQDSTIHKDS